MTAKRKPSLKIRTKRAKILWITDPWETLDHASDTTLRLAEEALKLGVPTAVCDVRSIRWDPDQGALLDARAIEDLGSARRADEIRLGNVQPVRPSEFPSLQYRTDPPVDLSYLQPLQLLVLGLAGTRTRLVNPPNVLALSNEKLEASWLGDLMPTAIASSQWEHLDRFGRREGRAVLKPLHLAQSLGVELLDWDSPSGAERARELVARATEGFTRPVVLQRYLEGIHEGEQRLWFLDGKLLACIRKLPKEGDFRVNMDQGSRLAKTRLNAAEKKAATRIGQRLRAQKIRLAAVDLIEGLVTDFNFTSPGLIVQMEKILGENLARPIVKALCRN
jgi:glutathione synthase